eukprot:1195372-Prorocentrum_minimum.AAC.16
MCNAAAAGRSSAWPSRAPPTPMRTLWSDPKTPTPRPQVLGAYPDPISQMHIGAGERKPVSATEQQPWCHVNCSTVALCMELSLDDVGVDR